MRFRSRLIPATIVSLMVLTSVSFGQRQELSVAYLRAAVNSLPDHQSVMIYATYLPEPGLVQAANRYIRGGSGYSRFSIKDPQSGAEFSSMYCSHDSKAFKDLISVTEPKTFRFYGYKDDVEMFLTGIFVEAVEPYEEPIVEKTPVSLAASRRGHYRITITDNVTSNRTVLADVTTGRSYVVGGVSISVEPEPTPTTEGSGVIGPQPEREHPSLPTGMNSSEY